MGRPKLLCARVQQYISKCCFPLDFKRHREDTYHVLDGIRESMFELNSTFSSHNLSVKATLEKLVKEVGDLADRLKVIETHPREVLIDQIEAIHKEVWDVCTGMGCVCVHAHACLCVWHACKGVALPYYHLSYPVSTFLLLALSLIFCSPLKEYIFRTTYFANCTVHAVYP